MGTREVHRCATAGVARATRGCRVRASPSAPTPGSAAARPCPATNAAVAGGCSGREEGSHALLEPGPRPPTPDRRREP